MNLWIGLVLLVLGVSSSHGTLNIYRVLSINFHADQQTLFLNSIFINYISYFFLCTKRTRREEISREETFSMAMNFLLPALQVLDKNDGLMANDVQNCMLRQLSIVFWSKLRTVL